MAEEEVLAAAAPSDLKRKHEDLEPETPEPARADSNTDTMKNESDSVKVAADEGREEEPLVGGESDESEAKRPRLEDKPEGLVTENGYRADKVDAPGVEDAEQKYSEDDSKLEGGEKQPEEALGTVNNGKPSDDNQFGDMQPSSFDDAQLESAQQQPSGGELPEPTAEIPHQGDNSSVDQQSISETQTVSRKMEVPNNKVGVLIGKAGDTIKFLQINSGAKIQITRDVDADPHSATRPVELIGTLESISKAERLIKDVIAEADAGGSPSLVARGFSTIQAAGAAEQILIQVPNEKVGVIIGKGGETIKSLQTRSGARIQVLIPQHAPEGDQSKERTVRVSGDKKQIEMAREMIKDVMNQPVRLASHSGGHGHQQFRPRGTAAPPQWGTRGPHPAAATGYDYRQQRGPYPSQSTQYPHHQAYGNYPQQMGPRSSFGPGWEQRPSTMQGPPPLSGGSGGYDYYGGQGHMVDAPSSHPAHGPGPSPMGPHTQGGYNYGQPAAPYSQTAPPQSYGHAYNENPATGPHSYGGHGAGPQHAGYPQGAHPGYGPLQQDQYGKAASYGMPAAHGPPQQYGQPRASQPGDMPSYQGQPYAQNAPPPQQTYPYAASGPMQQTYPPYGSSANDGYNQQPLPATGSVPAYPQQPASGYGQPGGQQGFGYQQVGQTGGYSSYPTSQPASYTEQPPPQNASAGYGYQGAVDPAFGSASAAAYGAPPTGQAGYAQPAPAQAAAAAAAPAPAPAPTQAGYDQSGLHAAGGYGSVPAGYGKSVSPQPGSYPQQQQQQQYDSAQMYGAPPR